MPVDAISREGLLCHPVRTAIGGYGGTLKEMTATDLGAAVIRRTLRCAGRDPLLVGSAITGNVVQAFNRDGAMAHGHPIGDIGAVLTTRLLRALRRDGIGRAVVSLCIGGGQGIPLALAAD